MILSRFHLCCALTALLMCVKISCAQQLTGAARDSTNTRGSITGRVINSAGEPLAGASIFANRVGANVFGKIVTTDESGNFKIEGVGPGLYSMSVTMAGYLYSSRPTQSETPNYVRTGDSVTFTLTKGGVITGTVTGPNGPLIGVGVFAARVKDADGKKLHPAFPGGFERRTDDRGVFRIYGLPPGAYVLVATRPRIGTTMPSPFDDDVPTFYPSGPRDTAAEIIVREGDEITADLHYRGEPGHTVSGKISGVVVDPTQYSTNLQFSLTDVRDLTQIASVPNSLGDPSSFAFYGVPDGEYELLARQVSPTREYLNSAPVRIKLKGADVTGLNLALAPLASIAGRLVFEGDPKNPCAKRKDTAAFETLVYARRFEPPNKPASVKPTKSEVPLSAVNATAQAVGDASGAFILKSLPNGFYRIDPRPPASGWYVRSIAMGARPVSPAGPNIYQDAVSVRGGDRITGVTVTITEGGALVRGKLSSAGSQTALRRIYLVPAEREAANNVYRFYEAGAEGNGSFTLDNVAPGAYWIVARPIEQNETGTTRLVRQDESLRAKVLREAETQKQALTLKPCEEVANFDLKYSPGAP
jgi:uncharacterized surface anchored protein